MERSAGPIAGVMDRLAEGQEELRGELGVLIERLDSLEGRVRSLAGEQSSRGAELERRQVQLAESFASGRRGRDRLLVYAAAASALIATAALILTLIR